MFTRKQEEAEEKILKFKKDIQEEIRTMGNSMNKEIYETVAEVSQMKTQVTHVVPEIENLKQKSAYFVSQLDQNTLKFDDIQKQFIALDNKKVHYIGCNRAIAGQQGL